MKKEKSTWDKFNEWEGSGCVWLIVVLVAFSLFGKSCSGGSELPLNVRDENPGNPAIELAGEPDLNEYYDYKYGSMAETAAVEASQQDNEYYYDRLTRTLQAEWTQDAQAALGDKFPIPQEYTSSCPSGCYAPPYGCDIKGNISFNTGEKIYHLPGDPYYNETVINTSKGDRWFCTEAEAQANGWRRAVH